MVNRQIRNPGELARFSASGRISEDVPSYAIDTGQAATALAQVAGGLSATLGKLADKARAREGQIAGLSAGQAAGVSYLAAERISAEAGAGAGLGSWLDQAKALLRKEEGFREAPYWDVNAHRVGYGSDTAFIDGKPVKVTTGTRVSRQQAEADLDYRLNQREGKKVREQLGTAWDGLPDSARAALASVGYNYGSLPASVVKAAGTGNLQALSAAVGSLGSNPERRRREAAMILSASGSDAAGAARPSATQVASTRSLSTEPLALRRDGTIYGDAFDTAALSAWGWRMQEGLSNDLFAAHQQFQQDPAGFAGATSEIREKYIRDLDDPQQVEMFDRTFADRSEGYARNIAANHEAGLKREQTAAFSAGLASRSVDLERQAQVLGATPDGDRIIGEQVAAVQSSIAGAVAAGMITAEQGEQQKIEFASVAARGRIQGVYDALENPEEKESFALSILDDWREEKSPLSALPFAKVKAISDTLRRDAREQINIRAAENKIEAGRLSALIDDDVASMAATGKGLDPDASGLTAARVGAIVGDDGLQRWQKAREQAGRIFDATNGMEAQPARDIEERLAMMAPEAGQPGFVADGKIYDAARKRAEEIVKQRSKDPAAAVQAAFPALSQQDDQTDRQDPAAMQALVASRLQAQAVLEISEYEQQPLTQEEALQLARPVSSQVEPGRAGQAMQEVVRQVQQTYGPHADRVLTQVLAAQGIDKEMAEFGAGFLARLSRGERPTTAEKRQAGVISEIVASERAGDPEAAAADPAAMAQLYPVPGPAALRRLAENPILAPQFDAHFGPGAAARAARPVAPQAAGIGSARAAADPASVAPLYPAPGPNALRKLAQQPELAPQFDAHFGPGAAARALGGPRASGGSGS